MAQIKTKDEILKIKKACRVTDIIFKNIIKNFNFKTEIELRDFILMEIRNKGLKPSFPPIVSGGKRAGNEIHPQSTNKNLSGFVIIDFGVVYKKYMSDMTRTVYVGVPTKKEIDLYNLLLKSQENGIALSVSGVHCANIDQNVRESFGNYKKYFIHTLGHGVGIKIHESPKLYYKITKPKLKDGMVITIEPGIYIKNKLGMRIEDTILINKNKPIILTKSPKTLTIFR